MKFKLIIQIFSTLAIIVFLCSSLQSNKEKECNFVPNEETAIKVAEAILVPIYGEEVLKKKPFTAILISNKFWRVKGTINMDELGGIPIVEIQKTDCKILSVTHTK
jgi:hypothetical protein